MFSATQCAVFLFVLYRPLTTVSLEIQDQHSQTTNTYNISEYPNIRHRKQHILKGDNVRYRKFHRYYNENASMSYFNATSTDDSSSNSSEPKSFGTRSVNNDSYEMDDDAKLEIPSFVAELPDTMDIVTKFLKIVEMEMSMGENCTAGTTKYLGEGIVDDYTRERFRVEAEFTVTRSNLLTRLWKTAPEVAAIDDLLYVLVQELMEFSNMIHAAGNCYGYLMNKDYDLFCPFATRMPNGSIMVKDLSREYHYLTNTSQWFIDARERGEQIASERNSMKTGFYKPRVGDGYGEVEVNEILEVHYEDGEWSQPYFDCGGGNIWMMSFMVPFFGFNGSSYYFKGTSGIDIDLRRVDIDQCPQSSEGKDYRRQLNIFAGSDKCKNLTTKCEFIPGLGFRRGSYNCACKRGYYFPDLTAKHRYYNGNEVEEEYEKKLMGLSNIYDISNSFECTKCPEGCDTCVDARPCLLTLNWFQRNIILALTAFIIWALIFVLVFLCMCSEVKVIKAASPVLLRIIILGAFLLYSTILIMYPKPTMLTCTIKIWLKEIGFFLSYGALMLKTWRISVVFRVRSAKAIKITDLDLIKRLGLIVLTVIVFLSVKTIVATPHVVTEMSHDNLKAFLCSTDWWDYAFTALELLFLMWGIGLCVVVRKAPSEFNESRYISMAIYNEFFLSIFLNVSMIFLHSPANPDLLYIIYFSHNQLTITLLLCLIFGSKVYMIFKGKENAPDRSTVAGSVCVGKLLSRNKRSNHHKEKFSSSSSTNYHSNDDGIVHIEEVHEEFCRLYSQLQMLKNRNMRLGNRHLVDKINTMQEVVNSGMLKHCGSTSRRKENNKLNNYNIQQKTSNRNNVYLKPETSNQIDSSLSDICDEPSDSARVVDFKLNDDVETKSFERQSLKANSPLLNGCVASTSSSSSSVSSMRRNIAAKDDSNSDSNQNYSNDVSEMTIIRTCPKARDIIINLDDPEYFTEELAV